MNPDTLEKIIKRIDKLSPGDVRRLFLRLGAENSLLQDVCDALSDGLILFSAEGNAIFANQAACTIYNRSLKELLREPFERLTAGACSLENLRDGGVSVVRDVRVNYPSARHYHFYITPLRGAKEYLLLVRDDTLAHENSEAAEEAGQFNLLTFLTSAIAHEIGNPLNSLGLSLQLLRRKLDKNETKSRSSVKALVDDALEETRRLDTLLQQFLQSMRTSKLERTKVQVNEVIERVLRLLAPEIAQRGAAIQTKLHRDLPEISADADRLLRVFYNLIRNALQSLPGNEGYGVSVSTSYNDSEVGISIGDNGSGISHEVMGTMYEPFRSTKSKGHGLGLLIARHIIRQHGGTLTLASRQGLGTTVTITLPRADKIVRLLGNTSVS